jgi:hypothetical protein
MTMVLAPDKRAQAAKQKADAAAAAEAAEAAEGPAPEASDTAPVPDAPEEITDDVPADVPETNDDEASEG